MKKSLKLTVDSENFLIEPQKKKSIISERLLAAALMNTVEARADRAEITEQVQKSRAALLAAPTWASAGATLWDL